MAADSFVLGVLGDFGGAPRDLDARRFVSVDRDNLDDVMGRLGVSFNAAVPSRLGAGELAVALRFGSPDDFHPDRIVAMVPALAALVKARSSLPSTEELARLRVEPAPRPETRGEAASAGLLDAIIGGQGSARGEARRAPADPELERFVREVAAPSLDRTDLGLLERWQRAVDEVVGRQLRDILYHPRFQALEAAWRGLLELVSSAETGPDLVIRVLDLPKAELVRDLGRLSEGDDCAITRLVCGERETFGGAPYAALVASYAFGPSEIDLTLLEVMGQVAARAGAPFIAGARPELLGLKAFRELRDAARIGTGPAWRGLCASEAGRRLVMCLPGVLLRLPYGPEGEPVRSFAFDEGLTSADHDRYLWGSPAFALARVLTRSFARDGWSMDPTEDATLSGLPLHVFREEGESRALPCAEVVMTETTLRHVADCGFVVMAAVRDTDEVVVYGLRTIGGGRVEIRRP